MDRQIEGLREIVIKTERYKYREREREVELDSKKDGILSRKSERENERH